MSADVKTAVEWLADRYEGLRDDPEWQTIRAHIDGEKERTLKALEAVELRAASVERRKVVRFLRRHEATIGEASDAIERGDHLRGWTHD